jgi:hypothetical protein
MRTILPVVLPLGWLVLLPAAVAAQVSDGSYGRLDGDVLLAAEAGLSTGSLGHALGLRATASYLGTAGLWAQYHDAFGAPGQALRRALSAGIELRPLFLARLVSDLEEGPAHFDLWLDSLGLSLGAQQLWANAAGCDGAGCSGPGMEATVGMQAPLLGQANTPFVALRGGVRWSFDGAGAKDVAAVLGVALGYERLLGPWLVDAGDELPP